MPPRPPNPAQPPGEPRDEPLADETGLDPSQLLDLTPPAPEGPPAPEEPAEPEPEPAHPTLAEQMAALLRPQPLERGEQLLDEDVAAGSGAPAPGWWQDPALGAYGDEDLLPAGSTALPMAGVEERVSLPELEGFSLPATLASALHGAVLSGELVDNEHGERGLWLGSHWVGLREAASPWRLLLGSMELLAPLELSDGPGPRLILGGDLLAGRLRIDPALRHQLGRPPKPRS